MRDRLGHAFLTIVRPVNGLRKILASDPYKGFRLSPGSKRIITFLRERPSRKLQLQGGAVFSVYVRNPKGPVFMTLIERTYGKEVTTRTWETVAKAAK